MRNLNEIYKNHYCLSGRNRGSSPKMAGLIDCAVVFVDEAESSWSDKDRESAKNVLRNALRTLAEQAGHYGTDLSFHLHYINAKIDMNICYNCGKEGRLALISTLGCSSEENAAKELKERYDAENLGVIYLINKSELSYAYMSNGERRYALEAATIFRRPGISDDKLKNTICHELCHTFGAVDYYYPERLKAVVKKYYPKDVMLHDGDSFSNLTAYCIGWTSKLSITDGKLLDEVADLSAEEVEKALEKVAPNGNGKTRFDHASYTGMMKNGLLEGRGLLVDDDGGKTFSLWHNHTVSKYKIVSYASGGIDAGHVGENGNYSGPYIFKEDQKIYACEKAGGRYNGVAACLVPDSYTYVGTMKDGKITGFGELRYSNGTIYRGEVVDGKAHGFGVMKYADGAEYTGSFVKGLCDGVGTYVNAGGKISTGIWKENTKVKST